MNYYWIENSVSIIVYIILIIIYERLNSRILINLTTYGTNGYCDGGGTGRGTGGGTGWGYAFIELGIPG